MRKKTTAGNAWPRVAEKRIVLDELDSEPYGDFGRVVAGLPSPDLASAFLLMRPPVVCVSDRGYRVLANALTVAVARHWQALDVDMNVQKIHCLVVNKEMAAMPWSVIEGHLIPWLFGELSTRKVRAARKSMRAAGLHSLLRAPRPRQRFTPLTESIEGKTG